MAARGEVGRASSRRFRDGAALRYLIEGFGMYPFVFGKYVLERELARGGMARVVLATLRGAGGFEKRLVVKQIRDELAFDSEWVRRFVEEAKTTVALSHPNIVPVYELGVEQGTYFLAMELVEGVTVAELLKSGGPLSPEEGAYVGVEVCRALDYAHRRMEVVHRDVTPRNVMVDEEGQVKVIDFGIAAPAEVAGHEVFGSPGHMPPEQIAGASLGPPTDLFAVAVTLMEAWSGKPAFRRKTPVECMEAMRGPHPKPSEANIRLLPLDAMVARAMSLDPSARPQQAEELGKALRTFLVGTDSVEVARGLGERVRVARSRAAEKAREAAEASVRPRAASLGEAGTKTFAARQEVGAWSAPQAEAPKPAARPERKLGMPTPATPVRAKLAMPTPATPVVAIQTRRLPPSVPPAAAEEEAEARVDKIETIATASIERAAPKPRAERSRALWIAVPVVGAAVAMGMAWRMPRGRTVDGGTATATAPASASASASAPAPAPTTAPASASASATATATATDSASPADTSLPTLTLLADPGTFVSIDGTPRGRCPLRDIALDPGAHDLRFTFPPTGESSGERVTLRPGERVTVRADFSSATPTIRIKR